MSDPNRIETGLDTDLGSLEAVQARKAELLAEMAAATPQAPAAFGAMLEELGRLNEEEWFYLGK
jgi:hypothetical protein